MTARAAGWVLIGLVLGAGFGCATLPAKPAILAASVTPDTVHPGEIVVLQVLSPAGTRWVRGRLGIPGSPTVALRSTDQGRTWTFKTQIPLEAAWEPGRYRVELQGEGPAGEALAGETWITAP